MKLFTFTGNKETRSHLKGADESQTRKRMLSFLGLLFAIFVFLPSSMQAQHPYGFMDGNVLNNDGLLDWEDVWDAQQSDPVDYSSFPAGTILSPILFDDQPGEYIFTGGNTKDHLDIPNWLNKIGTSSDKTNIQQAGAILIDGKIYFFGNRYSADGSTNIGFWFFQDDVTAGNGSFDGVHVKGDILVVAEIKQGGAVGLIAAYEWMGAGFGDTPQSNKTLRTISTGPSTLSAVVNEMAETTPWPMQAKTGPADTMPPITFFEGFIDIAGLSLTNACFSSFLVETRASFSVTSVLEDFVGGALNVQPEVTLDDITACETDAPVTLTAYVDGGIPPYTYIWTGPAGFDAAAASGTGDAYKSIEVSIAGEYSVTVECQGIVVGSTCSSETVYATVYFIDVPDLMVQDLEDCEDGTTGAQTFDLNDGVTDPDGGTISFHTSQAHADAGTNAIADPTMVSVNIGTTTYWVRSEVTEDDVVCYATASFDVTVYDNPDIVVEDLADCEEGDTGAQTFDLNDAVTDDDGGTVSFYTSEANAIAGTNAIASPDSYSVNLGTVTLWVRSDNDDDGEEGCYSIASFDVTVYDNPDLMVADLDDCEEGTTGAQTFDLNEAVTDDGGGELSFYESELDANNEDNAIADATDVSVSIAESPKTFWVRSENETNEDCFSVESFTVTVYDNPDVTTSNPEPICLGESVDLADYVTDADGGTLSYHSTLQDAEDGMNELMSTIVSPGLGSHDYFVRSENTSDSECYSVATITVTVITCDDFEGCTLGYWKTHTDRWCDAYLTCDIYGDIFMDAPAELADLTLLEVLNLTGGGIYNLGRQSVAALLNACSEDVNYELAQPGDVIDYVNANFDNAEEAGNYLDMLNQAGCPLDGTPATTEPSEDCNNGAASEPVSGDTNEPSVEVNGFNVSPVPFREYLNVQYDFDYVSDAVIQIYDMQGRLLSTQKEANASKGKITNLSINFRTLPSQVYVIKVTTDRDVFTKKIVSDK